MGLFEKEVRKVLADIINAKTVYSDLEENRALEFLYEQAREAGAELTVLKSNDTLGALCQLARDKHVDKFIMGSAPEQDVKSGFIGRLERKLNGSVEVITLPWESDQE